MATSLGSLVVSLGLDAAQYTAGLTKAERDAQKFARNVRSAVLEVGKILGGLAIGNEILQATKEIIAEAAALNDLADATGSTVESLSRLTNQAKIAGTDFATMQQALLKLSAGMAGVDDDSTKAKEALKLLGITTRDPGQALQEIAIKFDKYADGVNKVGLAVALFGKQGAGMVATLKDIAQLQDVTATVTTKQAQEAEKLEQAFNRLSVEATGFKNAILNDVVPALTNAIEQFRLGIQLAGGFFEALRLFGTLKVTGPTEQLRELNQQLANLEATKQQGGLGERLNAALGIGADARIADVKKQISFLEALQRQQQEAQRSFRQAPGAAGKPEAPFIAAGGGAAAKAAKERISDAEKLLESLEKQQQATLELNVAETAAVAIYDIRHKQLQQVTADQEAQILAVARSIDANNEAKKSDDEWRKSQEALSRAMDETARNIAGHIDASNREAEQIKAGNDAIREQIAFLTGGEEAVRRLADATVAATIAEKERALAIEAGLGATKEQLAAMQKIIDQYKERQAVLKEFDIAKQFAEEKRAAEDFARSISDSFSSAFEGFITGTKSAKDAFRAFVADIQSQLVRLALRNVMDSILGVKSGGPDAFSVIAKLLGSFAGAGGGGLGYGTIGSAIPIGPYPYANGTDFHPGGAAMVGEHGPEVLNLPRGAQVIPMNKWRGGGHTMTFNINVLPGASTASVRQAKAQLRDAVMSAVRDR